MYARGRPPRTISPYVPLIPLSYLADGDVSSLVSPLETFAETRAYQLMTADEKEVFLNMKMAHLAKYPNISKKFNRRKLEGKNWIYADIERELNSDFAFPSIVESASISNNTKEMHQVFPTATIAGFTMRAFSGLIGQMSMYTSDAGNTRACRILATIHPANLAYQRMHIMLHGTVDMAKVIFLIDETLQSPDTCASAMYTFYHGRIEPWIKATAALAFFAAGSGHN